MFRKLTCITLLGLFILSACGGNVSTSPDSPQNTPEFQKGKLPSLTGNWRIKMTHSGGIAGLLRSIAIKSDGSFIVMDERAGTTSEGQLSEEEFARIVDVVNASEYAENKEPYGCADCFIYNIEITGDGGKFSAQVDDISIEKSGLGTLVMALREILERELK